MYSKQDLMNDLKEMGLQPTDTVLVHSSYKSIVGDRGIEGGAGTVIDAFIGGNPSFCVNLKLGSKMII